MNPSAGKWLRASKAVGIPTSLCWLIWAAGCQSPEQAHFVELMDHAVEPLPYELVVDFDLDLSQASERTRWSRPAVIDQTFAEGLFFPADGGRIGATHPLNVDTDLVTHIELRLDGHHPATASIAWQPANASADIPWPSADTGGGRVIGGDRVLTFQLAAEPRWSGRISAIRVFLQSLGAKGLLLESVRGFHHRIPEQARLLDGQPFRLELARDTRDAVLASRGRVQLKKATLGPTSRVLEFAWGVVEPPLTPTRLELIARRGNDVETLWNTVVPVDSSESVWRDVAIPVAGSRRPVQFEWVIAPRVDPEAVSRDRQGSSEERGVFALANARLRPQIAPPQPDVVFISVDTLRADRVQPVDPPRSMSTRIGRWAHEHGASFENAVTQASWTLPSHASMLTGLDALNHGVGYPGSKMHSSRTSLAEVLRANGYQTLAITESGWLHPRFGLVQGFSRHRFKPPGQNELVWLEEMVQEAIRGLGRRQRPPMFWFLHTNVVHEYRQTWPHGDRKEAYNRAVTVLDQALAPLLAYASMPSTRARTLVVLTSDHGELLGENGTKGHGYLHEANSKIPLIIQSPSGLGTGQVRNQLVRSIDIVPTILESLGLGSKLGAIDGVSLLPLLRRESSHGARLASTYSSGGDFGLSLRSNRGIKYTLLNGARSAPAAPRERLWRIDGLGGQLALDPSSVPEAEHLRQLALHRLSEAHGLHVYFEPCAEQRIVRIQPRVGTFYSMAVRTTSFSNEQLRLSDSSGIEVRLSPHESGQIVIEQLPTAAIRLEIEQGTQDRWAADIDFQILDPPANAQRPVTRQRLNDSRCPVYGIWRSEDNQALDRPSSADVEIERELRALGYLGGS